MVYGARVNPIGSMYGIYANIWGILLVNVTIYSIHGSYGYVEDCWGMNIQLGELQVPGRNHQSWLPYWPSAGSTPAPDCQWRTATRRRRYLGPTWSNVIQGGDPGALQKPLGFGAMDGSGRGTPHCTSRALGLVAAAIALHHLGSFSGTRSTWSTKSNKSKQGPLPTPYIYIHI